MATSTESSGVLPWRTSRGSYQTVNSAIAAQGGGGPSEECPPPHLAAVAWRRGATVGALVVMVASLATCGLVLALSGASFIGQPRSSIRGSGGAGGLTTALSKKGGFLACEEDPDFAKNTLKLVKEETMFALFGPSSTSKYEASDVIVKGDYYYVVCDSSWAIYRVRQDLPTLREEGNTEILHLHAEDEVEHDKDEESSYEGIYHDSITDLYYLVREAMPHPGNDAYHAVIEEIRLTGDGETGTAPIVDDGSGAGTLTTQGSGSVYHELVDACETEDLFNGDSKGLEGVIGMHGEDGTLYLLGLCEGNYCEQKSENGLDKGNGVIIVFRKIKDEEDGFCAWLTVRHMSLPSSVDFTDYSAISYNPRTNMVAITSQEDAKLWVGAIKNPNGGSGFDPLESTFEEGQVYDFPPDEDCNTVYCNIEGISWISDNMVVAVSDQAKSKGRQDFRCRDKDQSVHVFMVPISID